jgi:hypothetical protein
MQIKTIVHAVLKLEMEKFLNRLRRKLALASV